MTMISGSFGEHSTDCWQVHQECALRSAISYLSARVEHDRSRLRLYRKALNDPRRLADDDLLDVIGMAKNLMADNSKINWNRGATA